MIQYIDKDALVAEIERRIKVNKECMLGLRNIDCYQGKVDTLNGILSFLDTLEAKEVDLEEEIDKELDKEWYGEYINHEKFKKSAKHFFELGLKTQKGE